MNWRPEKPRTRNEDHSWAKWRSGCSISRTVLYFVNNCVSCPFSYGHCIRLYIMISGYSFDISSSKSPKLVNYIFLFYSASSFKHTTYKTRRTYMSICFFVCVEPMFTNGVSAVVTTADTPLVNMYEIWSFMHDIIDYCFYEIK